MQYRTITRILGLLVALFSVTMIPPAIISLYFKDGSGLPFFLAFLLCLGTGLLFWYPNRLHRKDLRAKEGFLIVVLFWTVLASFGALPLLLLEQPEMSISDAFFEAFSGLTTTGATVIQGIDYLPKAVQFYRQQLQWLGGMGIIVLAVAILPILGVGGMQLYRAETPGPVKDSKMTPRIADTAKHLWYIYLTLTISCGVAYWFAGMDWFDALCHAFSTVAIGGFSNYDASLGYFDSPWINIVCVVFLWIAALNFALHYAAASGRTLMGYFYDPELRAFFLIQFVLVAVYFFVLMKFSWFDNAGIALDQALIQSVSFSTTAGFATTDFSSWPAFLPIMLIFSSFIGGCAGSTGGGLKVVRVLLLYLQGKREVDRLIHPKAVYTVKLGDRALPDKVVEAVWGFFSAYAMIFVVIMVCLIATGMDDVSAFTATAATLNNLGPGLGTVSGSFADVSDTGKWLLILAMLFGRLEVFSLLVLFSPTFWRS
ncbi:TrkH family potassium uptake protein [Paraglaciecola chathamensis]|jgi:trk system potassium uptake protein TrkH|uniref:Trk system potassium uptake protein n=3 Tax=Paraglaciecola chathamensis TaxID=368405 RepID=A0A8H9II53_9ALTE|nr:MULTISPECIES: TrkH family potassium uptake protein [Paraglaciecola]AEE20985.1 potassium uptake protein, TrkH family [Glaciecola sp. 4H-3-7+YE-5]MBJ2137728.1 potassium transporter [Paraglaciecola chathamensis]MBU3017647.1 TrkH family potassium uptake protein [Paraglaciecola agarilytica]MDO6560137.1 TrkH family potassium uptake protein [Paraglaciecola chathamensis]MDO6841144.1 TrkH family potassium uptake protein [Paraglaciecola chathamensis]